MLCYVKCQLKTNPPKGWWFVGLVSKGVICRQYHGQRRSALSSLHCEGPFTLICLSFYSYTPFTPFTPIYSICPVTPIYSPSDANAGFREYFHWLVFLRRLGWKASSCPWAMRRGNASHNVDSTSWQGSEAVPWSCHIGGMRAQNGGPLLGTVVHHADFFCW